jgi:uronate dehydrogenase
MSKVLLTGSAGSIGRVLSSGLTDRGHEVVGLDLPGRGADLEVDCTDPVAVDAAMAQTRPDAVVHLAGIPTESSLPDALSSHVVSTGALLEAMLRYDVPRIVYASSNHAVGRTPRTDLVGTDVHARPDTFYGVAKVAAEALLHLYVDRHGIDAVSTRIGSFLDRPTTRRQLATWLSPDDTVRMFDAALTAPSPGFAVVYGISANTRGWWDLGPGRALGYDPQDDAEAFAPDIESEPETEADRAQAAHVGGPFASGEFDRPAFD